MADSQDPNDSGEFPVFDSFCSHDCPHCGHHNIFPGFDEMFAYTCKACGQPVEVEPTTQ